MAVDDRDFQEQYFIENYFEGEYCAPISDNELQKREEAKRIQENDLQNPITDNQIAKQVNEMHKALLGSITPKEQSSAERIEQMKARKLAEGAIKHRNRN